MSLHNPGLGALWAQLQRHIVASKKLPSINEADAAFLVRDKCGWRTERDEREVVQAIHGVLAFTTFRESSSSPPDGLVNEVENEVGVERKVHLRALVEVFRESYNCL